MNLLKRNVCQVDIDLANNFSGTPAPSIWTKWFGGIIVPSVILRYGIKSCVVQKSVLFSHGRYGMELDGPAAIAMGITWICLALFLHFHYFWPTLKRLYIFTDLGKIVVALGFIASLGYVFWSIMKSWV